MDRINVLDISVANMIAAGEVVERPASVVKELVENSIDAGATSICVEIKNGGISYIRVTDDGRGIDQEDVGLAFVRHATSKISEAKDLEAIGTLGFRGEALCSVAAVAKVTLTTKTAAAKVATRVYISGGEMENVDEVGAPDGTTIEVRDLFYNTPARMKFLKKDTTEMGYITDIMERFILAHPEVSFRYINAGKQVLFSTGDGELINAIYTVYGADYARGVIPINYGDSVVSVSGYIGKSTISRPNRTYQSFFVNDRYIKSRTATVALEEAYKNQLMGGKFPFAVVKFTVNPAFVDVNVHPNKTEVKFSDEKKVFDTLYWAVKNALYEKPVIPEVSIKEKKEAYKIKSFDDKKTFVQTLLSIEEEKKPASVVCDAKLMAQVKNEEKTKDEENIKDAFYETKNVFKEQNEQEYVVEKRRENMSEAKPEEIPTRIYIEENITEKKANTEAISDVTEEKAEIKIAEDKKSFDDYKIVGTAFNTYIILEDGDRLLLIDQHAAHERIKFEQLMLDIKSENVKIQPMLSPIVVDLSAIEASYVDENMKRFLKLGFEIEPFGENTVIINSAPADTDYNDIKDLFIELLGQMMADKKNILSEHDERALYTVACKAAIKANHALNEAEIRALVEKVLELDAINTCPHGRPITISLTRYELEKQFKRVL